MKFVKHVLLFLKIFSLLSSASTLNDGWVFFVCSSKQDRVSFLSQEQKRRQDGNGVAVVLTAPKHIHDIRSDNITLTSFVSTPKPRWWACWLVNRGGQHARSLESQSTKLNLYNFLYIFKLKRLMSVTPLRSSPASPSAHRVGESHHQEFLDKCKVGTRFPTTIIETEMGSLSFHQERSCSSTSSKVPPHAHPPISVSAKDIISFVTFYVLESRPLSLSSSLPRLDIASLPCPHHPHLHDKTFAALDSENPKPVSPFINTCFTFWNKKDQISLYKTPEKRNQVKEKGFWEKKSVLSSLLPFSKKRHHYHHRGREKKIF